MACKKCGSDWVTQTGRDCSSCPHCDKQQLFKARQQGRWVEPVAVKQCACCGRDFEAVGTKHIKQRVLCGNAECEKQRRKDGKKRRASGVYVQQQLRDTCSPLRFCKRCGKGPLSRHQKHYCGKKCAGADAREFKRDFRGVPAVVRQAISIADWFLDWRDEHRRITSCLTCGAHIVNTCGQRKFCDDSCRWRYDNPLPADCEQCGSKLNASHKNQKVCLACKKKRRNEWKKIAGKTPRKRCKKHGVPCDQTVRSRAVFERDGYSCQLCGRQCLKKFTIVDGIPHPLSPTVDHIFAISLGIKGHTWDNVQCACWECNVAKGAAAQGQLRLQFA